ncbi:MAG: hypothetical protein JHC95_11610 [Solirubrobacteraceae bacterium]|nr:hypothetical protein [Solirubrobacteraceae bacterium]
MSERPSYSAEQVDAAVEALTSPGALDHAQEVVTHAAPSLQRVLNEALHQGGYFGEAYEQQVRQAVDADDIIERDTAMRLLLAEESRLAMLVGVTVGFELARELANPTGTDAAPDPRPAGD